MSKDSIVCLRFDVSLILKIPCCMQQQQQQQHVGTYSTFGRMQGLSPAVGCRERRGLEFLDPTFGPDIQVGIPITTFWTM